MANKIRFLQKTGIYTLVVMTVLQVPKNAGAQAVTFVPTDPAVLKPLIAEGIAGHPNVGRMESALDAAQEIPSQKRSLPDPMLMIAAQNIRVDEPGLDTSPMSGVLVSVQQRFPFPGLLGRSKDVAESQASSVSSRLDVTRARTARVIRHRFWQLYFQERALAIIEEQERVINTLVDVVQSRFAVGKSAQQDALQAQVAHSWLRSKVLQHQQNLKTAQRTLNSAVGRPPEANIGAVAAVTRTVFIADRNLLKQKLSEANPDIDHRKRALETAQLALRESRYAKLPNLVLGTGYRIRDTVPGDPSDGADMFTVSFGASVPLWAGSKQNAKVRQRTWQVAGADAGLQSMELEVTTRFQQTLDTIERLDQQIDLYNTELLAEADQALDASITDYQYARVQFMSVLGNWRTLLATQLDYERLWMEWAMNWADIKALIGTDLEGSSL